MSAFKYFVFVMGIVLVAVFAAILNEFVRPLLDMASRHSSTTASATGIEWASQAWTWMPLVVLLLLVFALIVAVVIRRGRTVGGI